MIISYTTMYLIMVSALLNVLTRILLVGRKPPVTTNGMAAFVVILNLALIGGLAYTANRDVDGWIMVPVCALAFSLGTESNLAVRSIGRENPVYTASKAVYAIVLNSLVASLAFVALLHV